MPLTACQQKETEKEIEKVIFINFNGLNWEKLWEKLGKARFVVWWFDVTHKIYDSQKQWWELRFRFIKANDLIDYQMDFGFWLYNWKTLTIDKQAWTMNNKNKDQYGVSSLLYHKCTISRCWK